MTLELREAALQAQFPPHTLADIAEGLEKGYEQRINVGEDCPAVESTTAYAARFLRAYLAAADSEGVSGSDVPARPTSPAGFVKPDNDRQVFFYEQDFYVLSNFSAFNLQWKGVTFATSEHAYHYEKFKDHAAGYALAVRAAPSAHEAFKIAEKFKADRRTDWDDIKVPLMLGILREKANQHEYVRRKLLATGNRELIEDSWRDDFWGWGPNRDGQNMLGKLWMQVRDELRAAPPVADPGQAGKGETK